MPLYEYQCDSCGRRFERIQKFSDPLVTTCPHCGGQAQRLISSPAIQFKGSGFYITDYARSGKSGEGEKSSKSTSESKSGGGEAASGDSTSSTTSAKTESSTPESKPATESKESETPKTPGKSGGD